MKRLRDSHLCGHEGIPLGQDDQAVWYVFTFRTPLAQPNSPFAMVNDLRPRPWRYLYAVPITENGVAAEGVDTGRSIKEVEMYLTGLSYREVLERALRTLAGISSHLIRNRKAHWPPNEKPCDEGAETRRVKKIKRVPSNRPFLAYKETAWSVYSKYSVVSASRDINADRVRWCRLRDIVDKWKRLDHKNAR